MAKQKKFKSPRDKRDFIVKVLLTLALKVSNKKFGEDGCASGKRGYCIADIVSDAMEGYPI